MIPESFIQELLNRVNVEDVVGQYVQLKKKGANLFGLCPFHQEKTGSFSVSPQKQFFHCFSCGQGGTAIDFLMKHLGLSFPEAVKMLASRVGLQVPEKPRSPQQIAAAKEIKTKSDQLHDCLEKAQLLYKKQLREAKGAITYLKNRGLDGNIAKKFGLGWSSADWQGLKKAFENYDDSNLVDAGLVIQNEDLRKYDRFRERITFPIYNSRGKIIGFGGRVIGNGQPKYLNSPETPIFHKGSELYGLFENRLGIHKEGFVLVVEGYMDVVGLAQLGLENAVATLGTATTEEHIKKLIRVSTTIVFSFDGDQAGYRAAWKALTTCLPLLRDDITIRFLFLPEGHDPDTYIRAFGQDKFRDCIEQSFPLSKFFRDKLEGDYKLKEAEGRSACLHDIRDMLIAMPQDVNIRVQIERDIAQLLCLTHEELRHDLRRHVQEKEARHAPLPTASVSPVRREHKQTYVTNQYSPYAKKPMSISSNRVDSLAMRILRLLIHHPEIVLKITERQLEILSKHPHYALVAQYIALCMSTGTTKVGHLLDKLDAYDDLKRIVSAIRVDSLSETLLDDPFAEWLGIVKKVEILSLELELTVLSQNSTPENRQRYVLLCKRLHNLKNLHS